MICLRLDWMKQSTRIFIPENILHKYLDKFRYFKYKLIDRYVNRNNIKNSFRENE